MYQNSHHRHYRSLPARRNRYANPYFRSRQADSFSSSKTKHALSRITPRGWLCVFLFIVTVSALTWLLGFSSVFTIKHIDIRGAEYHDHDEIASLARYQSSGNRWLVFPQSRLFVFDSQDLEKTLNQEYALNYVTVVKKLPGTLVVKVEEKIPAAVWFEADVFYEVDAEGWIVRSVGGPQAGEPTIYNNGSPRISGKQVTDSRDQIAASRFIATQLPQKIPGLGLRQLVVDDEARTLKMIVEPRVIVFLTPDETLASQFERLDLLIQHDIKDKLEKLSYIDLRYGDKVYYK